MTNTPGELRQVALTAVIAAMALTAGCDFRANGLSLERTNWDGTPHLPAQAASGSPVIYLTVDLDKFLSPHLRQIQLPLPDGTSVTVEKTGEESRGTRRLVWKGRIEGERSSVVTLATSNGLLAGNILSSRRRMYRMEQVAPGTVMVFEVNRNLFPAEAQPLNARESIGLPGGTTASSSSCPADNAQNIEVMFLYTTSACIGSVVTNTPDACTSDAQEKIENDILIVKGETNTTFTESQVPAEASLAPEISVVKSGPVGEYTETNDLVKERTRLLLTGDEEMEDQGTQVAYLDDVGQWRNQYRADVVALVTKPAGDVADGPACGASSLMGDNQAWFEKYAFVVVPIDCMNLNQSFTHELGHLLGAGHQSATPSQVSNFSDNNRAHVQLTPTQSTVLPWRTVMAENDSPCTERNEIGCGRVLHFSNPAVDYEGDPTGATTENNNEVVRATAGTVAQFRRALSCGNP